jgi:hypothetical protein
LSPLVGGVLIGGAGLVLTIAVFVWGSGVWRDLPGLERLQSRPTARPRPEADKGDG